MPPKKGGGASNDLKQEVVLQGVLFADSFSRKFPPITFEKPKMLLPLVNVPMIDYCLEFLISGGVKEIFVFCSSHADQIRRYLRESKWSSRQLIGTVRIELVESQCSSMGDALRHLDLLHVIKSDFVLISGDVVSNMKLQNVVKAHRCVWSECHFVCSLASRGDSLHFFFVFLVTQHSQRF